jgi:hypothetical protein
MEWVKLWKHLDEAEVARVAEAEQLAALGMPPSQGSPRTRAGPATS